MSSEARVPLLLALVLALCLASAALAGPPAADPPADSPDSKPSATYVTNGVTIAWDADAKELRQPNAEEAAALVAELRRLVALRLKSGKGSLAPSLAESEVVTLENGMKAARLPADFLHATVVTVGPDGRLAQACLDAPAEASEAPSVAKSAAEEK